MEKTYVASFELGKTSDTEDVCGTVFRRQVETTPTLPQVNDACAQLVGTIQQRPPAFSAVKIKGRRAYKLARQGKPVELTERPVEVMEITPLTYRYPELVLRIRCGSGTYVRSLGRDLGESLGCGAVMQSLRRTAIGRFVVEEGRTPKEILEQGIPAVLLPVRKGLVLLPQVQLTADQAAGLPFGAKLGLPEESAPEVVALDAHHRVLAVLVRSDAGDYRPHVNFVAR